MDHRNVETLREGFVKMEVAWDDVTSEAGGGKERPLWACRRDLTLLIPWI